MGCDGGTIPRRDELVRVKKKPETKDKTSELAFQWRCCAITQQTLQEPIVVCGLGRLYSKVALIESLLNKEAMPESAKHIKSLKDVRNLNLTANPAFKDNDQKGGSDETLSAPYICPVIGLEMSGKFRFVAVWKCGCVFSERALKQVPTTNCHKCQKPFEAVDVVVINGNDEDLVLMRTNMETRQATLKKSKKKTKEKDIKEIKVEVKDEEEVKQTPSTSSSTSNIAPNNGLTESSALTLKRSGALQPSRFEEKAKKAKSDYSIAKDPNATDVYKSLFTTHKSEKEQERAHWITYNPFYN